MPPSSSPSAASFSAVDCAHVGHVLRGRDLDKLEKARPLDDPTGKRSLRVVICTENWLPKVDGVTRTVAKLLEHLQAEGHEAMILGPNSGSMKEYAGAEVVGTEGIPLLGVYKGLALNFMRPRFIRKIREFQPDVIQFVDPIWLCAQAIPLIQYYFPNTPLVASYHTNLASYSTLFGFGWLTPSVWSLQRNLHARCKLTFCPSPSTQRMLESQSFRNVRLWPRGVYTTLFRPDARDHALRQSWGAEAAELNTSSRRSSLDATTPSARSIGSSGSESKVVMLYVGRISWEKNLRLLVEAFRGLQQPSEDGRRPACQLVFVGDGPSRPDLESLCASYSIDAVFMGYRKGQELAAAFASADIFAFPSWTETFGQVVLESLASGLPVVGLRAEGVCDLVQDGKTGLLLDMDRLRPHHRTSSDPPAYTSTPDFVPLPRNPHELVGVDSPTFPLAVSMYRSLLSDLATDHSLRQSMSRAAVEYASTKSWHSAMEMIVDGYREVVGPLVPVSPPLKPINNNSLTLSRTPTIELDVVCDGSEQVKPAEIPTSAGATGRRRRRLLRFGGVFNKKTGKIYTDGSISGPISSWLGRREPVEDHVAGTAAAAGSAVAQVSKGEGFSQLWALRWVLRLLLLSYILHVISTLIVKTEPIAALLA